VAAASRRKRARSNMLTSLHYLVGDISSGYSLEKESHESHTVYLSTHCKIAPLKSTAEPWHMTFVEITPLETNLLNMGC
jgi:hypothetical protein